MNFRTLLVALSTLTLAACAGGRPSDEVSPDISGLVGTWISAVAPADSNVVERSLRVRDDGVILETRCRADGRIVTVEARSPAIVGDHTIAILRTDAQYKAAGSEVCTSRVERGTIDYSIEDGVLRLAPEGKPSFVFGRKAAASGGLQPEGEPVKLLGQPGQGGILL